MSSQPRFMLIQGKHQIVDGLDVWVIMSSSDKSLRLLDQQLVYLDHLIRCGTVRPNNFGHEANCAPERHLEFLDPSQPIEHHGHFRTLKDVRDYICTIKLIG